MTTKTTSLVVARRVLAKLLSVSLRHLADLEADGVILPLHRGRGGRASTYALETVIPAYLSHATSAPASGAERQARQRRDLATARLTELRIAREQAELVSRDQVLLEGQAFVKGWTARVRVLPRQLVQAGILARDEETRAAAVCRDLLIEISGWKTIADTKRPPRRRMTSQAPTGDVDPRLKPVYTDAPSLRRRLDDPKDILSRVQPSLREAYERLVAEGRGIVEYGSGGWTAWPPSKQEDTCEP